MASGTTSGGGLFAISIAAGTYAFEVTGPTGAGFAFNTGSVAYSGGTVVRILVADSDHVCLAATCNYPIPKTLNGTAGTLTWFGGANWRFAASIGSTGYAVNGVTGLCEAGSSGDYSHTLSIGATTATYTISVATACCSLGGDAFGLQYGRQTFPGVLGGGPPGDTSPITSCYPFAASFDLATSFTSGSCSGSLTTPGGGAIEVTA